MRGITKHQLEVLQQLQNAPAALDLDQLLPRLSWGPSKEAAQFTIRALVKKNFLVKLPLTLRRGRLRVSYQITPSGRLVLDPRLDLASEVEIQGLEEGLPGAVQTP